MSRTLGGILVGLFTFIFVTMATLWILNWIFPEVLSRDVLDIWDTALPLFAMVVGGIAMFEGTRRYLRLYDKRKSSK